MSTLQIFVLLDCQGDESVNNKTMFGQISKLDVGLTQDDVDNVLAALQSDTKQVDFDDFLYKIAQLGATDRMHTFLATLGGGTFSCSTIELDDVNGNVRGVSRPPQGSMRASVYMHACTYICMHVRVYACLYVILIVKRCIRLIIVNDVLIY